MGVRSQVVNQGGRGQMMCSEFSMIRGLVGGSLIFYALKSNGGNSRERARQIAVGHHVNGACTATRVEPQGFLQRASARKFIKYPKYGENNLAPREPYYPTQFMPTRSHCCWEETAWIRYDHLAWCRGVFSVC